MNIGQKKIPEFPHNNNVILLAMLSDQHPHTSNKTALHLLGFKSIRQLISFEILSSYGIFASWTLH